MLKALLDTNQLVSSLLSSQGLQQRLIDAWRARSFVLLLAPGQLEEIGDVLARPKIARRYRIALGDRDGLFELLRAEAILLPHAEPPGVCRDPDDDYILGCAALGGAEYLITGDDDLLAVGQYRDVVIVDARTFVALLGASQA